ncbi:MAG: protein kinase [Anaerolineae bacterium]|nr:protein kinase [Anaerolineae bacterium]
MAMLGLPNLSNQKFGQYELRRLLGAGGMGAVYLGWQASLKREVAIKILPPTFAANPEMVGRFTREAETAARLEHPHIVPIYDYGVEQGISYVVMRLLPGGSLAERLTHRAQNDDPLPNLRETADMLTKLASALDFAHSKGVVHRDIKSNNVMFDAHGTPFLVDFGIARLVNATSALTGSNVQIGTPAYMSPEQWMGEEATAKSDQYAMGVMAYVLLTGDLPFEGQTPFALMHKHLNEPPTPPHLRRVGLSESLTPIISQALAKSPADRFETVSDFAAAFTSAIVNMTPGQATSFFVTPLPISINEIAFTPLPSLSGGAAFEPSQAPAGGMPPTISPGPMTQPDKPTTLISSGATWLGEPPGRRKGLIVAGVVIAALAFIGLFALFNGDDGEKDRSGGQSTATSPAVAENPTDEPSASSTSPATATASATATTDFGAIAGQTLTFEAGVNAAATAQVAQAQTLTATVWTATPTPTITPVPTTPAPPNNNGGPLANRTPILNNPDGLPGPLGRDRVVFVTNRDGDAEIVSINPDARFTQASADPITNNDTDDLQPSISGDGNRIAIVREVNGNHDIFWLDKTTQDMRPAVTGRADDVDPAWSPIGDKLAYASNRDGDYEIYIFDPATDETTQVTDNDTDDRAPAWSPDMTKLVFSADDGRKLVAVDLSTDEHIVFSEEGTTNGAPDWAANGTQIVFASDRDEAGNVEIYLLTLPTREVTRLTDRPGTDDEPVFSPDDRFILFQSDSDNGNFDLWIIAVDGSLLRQVTRERADDTSPDW